MPDVKRKNVLFLGSPTSIHTARWLSQFIGLAEFQVNIAPSTPFAWHLDILNMDLALYKYPFPSEYRYLEDRDSVIVQIADNIDKLIRQIKPDIIHTLQVQNSAYPVLFLKRKYGNDFPLWFCSAWGGDITYYGELENHKEKTQAVLDNIDALFSGDMLSINAAREKGFDKPILNVPSPGGLKIDEYKDSVDFIKPSKRKKIAVKGYASSEVHKPEVIFKALEMCAEDIKKKGLSIIIYMSNIGGEFIKPLTDLGISVEEFPYTDDHKEVLKMFSTARINLASSITDGVPNSMIEGMIMGAFPVQSDAGSVREYVEDGINGFLLDTMDVESFAEKLKQAIYDDELVDNAVNYSYNLIKSRMDYEVVRNKVFDFYNTFSVN